MFFLADFSVIKPDPGLLIWTIVIFAIFWSLMAKYGFKPMAQALKDRENEIQNSLDEAKKAREEVSSMKTEHARLFREAQEEKALILKEAKEAKDGILAEARNKAGEETKRMIQEAKLAIDNQKMAAITDIKNQAGMMAIDIAEKVIRKNLKGDAAQESFVQDLVNELNIN